MTPTRTPEGQPNRCPLCGKHVVIEPSLAGDATCPHCGCLLWFTKDSRAANRCGFWKLTISDASIRTRDQAIVAILDRLVAAGSLEFEHRADVLAALLKREELGSTAIGRGVAVPHCVCAGIHNTVGAMVRFPFGVDFRGVDREPVKLVCLLLSPAERQGEHLRLLETVSRQLANHGDA